jgi:DNA-binding response OmpR family regulator
MNPRRILVVEDDNKVAELLRLYLEKDGYQVAIASDGLYALKLAEERNPDIILLDLNLPKLDGIEVCRALRRKSEVPIIMVTARDEDTDKIVGLELGADDYITKPFSPREVVARVRAVLRRAGDKGVVTERISVGEIVIDVAKHEAFFSGAALTLTPTEFKLLTALSQNPGRVFTRLQLLDMAYGQTWEGYERNIDTHVKNLRQKMTSLSPGHPNPIVTVHGVGYKFEV